MKVKKYYYGTEKKEIKELLRRIKRDIRDTKKGDRYAVTIEYEPYIGLIKITPVGQGQKETHPTELGLGMVCERAPTFGVSKTKEDIRVFRRLLREGFDQMMQDYEKRKVRL